MTSLGPSPCRHPTPPHHSFGGVSLSRLTPACRTHPAMINTEPVQPVHRNFNDASVSCYFDAMDIPARASKVYWPAKHSHWICDSSHTFTGPPSAGMQMSPVNRLICAFSCWLVFPLFQTVHNPTFPVLFSWFGLRPACRKLAHLFIPFAISIALCPSRCHMLNDPEWGVAEKQWLWCR